LAARLITDTARIGEPSFFRRWWRRLRIVALAGVLTLFALEGLVRLIGFAPAIDWRNGWMEAAPGIPYRPRPNSVLSGRSKTDEYDYHHRHNSAGFRDVEHALIKPGGTFRILGLGDSFTAGWGAGFEETYLRRAEVALNGREGEHPRIEIVKAGINGYFPETQRLLLENYGLRYRPDLVVVGFSPNDVFDTWMGIDAIVVSKQGWLTSRDATELGRLGTWLYVNSHVARIPLDFMMRGRRALFFDGDWGTTMYRPDEAAEAAWQRVLEEYDRMDRAIRQAGGRLVVFYIPADPPLTAMHEYPAQRLAAWAGARGIEVISALPEMRAGLGSEALYWPRDGHCTPAGYRILGEVLARELDARGLVP
jgi:lysophospholipase L1-like esterase